MTQKSCQTFETLPFVRSCVRVGKRLGNDGLSLSATGECRGVVVPGLVTASWHGRRSFAEVIEAVLASIYRHDPVSVNYFALRPSHFATPPTGALGSSVGLASKDFIASSTNCIFSAGIDQ